MFQSVISELTDVVRNEKKKIAEKCSFFLPAIYSADLNYPDETNKS